jgi:hypothetical protein
MLLMGTKLHQLRVDDEVWDAIQALRGIFGTVNAGLRMKFGLGAARDVELVKQREASSLPPPGMRDEKKDTPVVDGEGCSANERDLVYEMEDV